METTISLKGTGTRLKTELDPPLLGDYKIALQNLSTYYSWSNITSDNNELKYTKGGVQKTITVPKGAYGIKDIALFVGAELERKGDDKAFLLGGNSNTLKVHIDVKSTDCVVNIRDSSIKSVLGWTTGNLSKGTHSSDKKVNITNINKLLVNCNIVIGEYTATAESGGLLSSQQTVLANFDPDVPPGYRVIIEPQRLYYKRANTTMIKNVEVWLTDENNIPIDNEDEKLFVSLHLKPLNK